jgi:membrane associated rhomboid family serine protease
VPLNEPPALCTIVILVVTVAVSLKGFQSPAFQERFMFDPTAILRHKELFRMVTSGFLHLDWIHLLCNTVTFYLFAPHLERDYGVGTLLLIYFGAIVGGGLLSLWVHRHHDYRALGASGGVCGVVLAWIFLFPGGAVQMLFVPFSIPGWLYAIFFLVASYVALRRQADNIGHDAHLGGAVIGVLIATALHPALVAASPWLYAATMLLSVGLLVCLWLNPLYMPATNPVDGWRTLWSKSARRVTRWKHRSEEAEMDRLLDKISKSGLDSLSLLERKRLDLLAQRKKTRDQSRR